MKKEILQKRIPKDVYYLGMAKEASKRGVCLRRYSGAIIVRDDQIISTGYTGCPRKTRDCFERGSCLRTDLGIPSGQRYELCRSVHAEQNAIINAARAGVNLLNGDMFIYGEEFETNQPLDAFPCFICKKMIINAGLIRVVCSTKNGEMIIFQVEDWAKDWQDPEKDIIDDKHQYGEPIELTPLSESHEESPESTYEVQDGKFPEDDEGDEGVPF